MSRSLLVVAICFATAHWLSAEEPASSQKTAYKAPAVLQPSSDATPTRTVTGKQKLEAQLHAPAKLDFGDRQTVTIREVLDQLRHEQHLSIRFDMPTLTSVLIEAAPTISGPVPAPMDESDEGAPVSSSKTVRTQSESAGRAASTQTLLAGMLDTPVEFQTVDLENVSVATVLRHAFDAVPTAGFLDEDLACLPIEPTKAWHLDYVVEDDGLVITTRLNAMTQKETRVYSVKHLKEFTPEQLSKVIRSSIRPWSWRSQINELGEQLKLAAGHISPETVSSLMKSGVQLTSCALPVQAAKISDANDAPECKTCDATPAAEVGSADAAQLTEAARTVIDVLTAFAQAAVSAVEIVHYADPPTGTIQTLPGKLVITQSQAAHREIAELLKELGED